MLLYIILKLSGYTVLGYYTVVGSLFYTRTFFNHQINVYEPFCTVFFLFFLPWTKTGTDPASGDLTARAKPLSNVGQFVTELNVPTVLTQQAQKLCVAAIKNYGNQISVFYHSIFAFNVMVLCPVFCVYHVIVPYLCAVCLCRAV